jgi:hypothetical protein
LDDSIADSFWSARCNFMIHFVNHLKTLFKYQQKWKFENTSDPPQLERKGTDTREAPGISGRF